MTLRQRVLRWFHERPRAQAWALLAPGGLWLLVFFVAPVLIMFGYSFMPRNPYGGVELGFTLEHYRRFFDPLYFTILLRTTIDAVICTVACLLLGYPVAYAIARGGRLKNFLLFLVVLPFWTSFLVRTFAMIFLMRDSGLLNSWMIALGWISEPIEMLYTPFAVLLGLVYGFLPFMVLPIYATLEKMDESLIEAAADLGCPRWKAFWLVTLPLSLPGMIAGALLCFIPIVGEFVIPDLLGGSESQMIGQTLWTEFFLNKDWPVASAVAVALLCVLLVPIVVYQQIQSRNLAQGR